MDIPDSKGNLGVCKGTVDFDTVRLGGRLGSIVNFGCGTTGLEGKLVGGRPKSTGNVGTELGVILDKFEIGFGIEGIDLGMFGIDLWILGLVLGGDMAEKPGGDIGKDAFETVKEDGMFGRFKLFNKASEEYISVSAFFCCCCCLLNCSFFFSANFSWRVLPPKSK